MECCHAIRGIILLLLGIQVIAECPEEYYNIDGFIDGMGQIEGNFESTMIECGEKCSNNTECCSFEFSYSTRLCNLNRDCAPSSVKSGDYFFCIKDKDFDQCDEA